MDALRERRIKFMCCEDDDLPPYPRKNGRMRRNSNPDLNIFTRRIISNENDREYVFSSRITDEFTILVEFPLEPYGNTRVRIPSTEFVPLLDIQRGLAFVNRNEELFAEAFCLSTHQFEKDIATPEISDQSYQHLLEKEEEHEETPT